MKSEAEISTDYVGRMGLELSELFDAISNELTTVHFRWKQYRILFAEKPSRIDLLNESAPFFFQIIQNALMEDTLLGIARLVGPAKSAGKSNLSLERLTKLIRNPKFAELQKEAENLVETAKNLGEFAIEWRHRRIAHQDLDLVLGKSPTPLPDVTRDRIEKVLSALGEVLNRIAVGYGGSPTAYSWVVAPDDAKELLYVIRDGLLHRRESQERLQRGEPSDADLEPREDI
jgi:hypothetical protein